jgi:hypothetical protein
LLGDGSRDIPPLPLALRGGSIACRYSSYQQCRQSNYRAICVESPHHQGAPAAQPYVPQRQRAGILDLAGRHRSGEAGLEFPFLEVADLAVGNDAQRKKGQDRSTPMPHFLLTFGDASRPPVGAVILEAPSVHQARMTAVVRRLAPGVPFGEGLLQRPVRGTQFDRRSCNGSVDLSAYAAAGRAIYAPAAH